MVIAFGAGSDMPPERFGSAGLYRRHYLQLTETDMTGIGPPICGSILPKDVSDLQLRARQPPRPLLQTSPDGVILQLLQHLVGADGAADGLGRDVCITRRSAEL